ncbi:unnamed protein product [Adineta ricciae]|uniref:Uncharacterized protein n=1 Tax=Adineta ricciae TaxID=249248 RepID=A0A814SL06_ADIRI|nr:unnamed protein product [Adineta ricciae]CAF1149754.1 unnamed protein product [Adineta ricciae]
MVLYYGLLALETANNTIAANATATSTTTIPRTSSSDRTKLSRKQKYLSNSVGKMPSSSLSTSNSWIYTEDLRKRFEERYIDCRYVFVPVYIDSKSSRRNRSTNIITSQKVDNEHSWMYSRSLRDHLFYSTSKISLPLTTNISSSACCVTNHGFMRDEHPIKKTLKSRLFKRSSSTKENSTRNLSSSFRSFTSSTSSFPLATNHLGKHRTNVVVEEEDDEGVDDENHSAPLIKHDSTIPSLLSTSHSVSVSLAENNSLIKPSPTSDLTLLTTNKQTMPRKNRLTRLRSFFFKSSSHSQQHNTLSTSSLSNRILTT